MHGGDLAGRRFRYRIIIAIRRVSPACHANIHLHRKGGAT